MEGFHGTMEVLLSDEERETLERWRVAEECGDARHALRHRPLVATE